MYKLSEDLWLAKRNHNKKRKYLLVNEKLAKHIPTESRIEIREDFPNRNEKILVIGFAETATALAVNVAGKLAETNTVDIVTTTREEIGEEYIPFLEEHSHATEQKLARIDFTGYDSIYFVDDEITTGKTLINILNQLDLPETTKVYAYTMTMRTENLNDRLQGIVVQHTMPFETYDAQMEETVIADPEPVQSIEDFPVIQFQTISIPDIRKKPIRIETYLDKVRETVNYVAEQVAQYNIEHVIGTEECMFPAVMLGELLHTKTQSTTRSPIGISTQQDYPIQQGYSFDSFYDSGRTTYIYNIPEGKSVLILTDAKGIPSSTLAQWKWIAKENHWKNLVIATIPLELGTYRPEDVTILLKDLTGAIESTPLEERERLIQSGVSYSEMLPQEYEPTEEYLEVFKHALQNFIPQTADALSQLAMQVKDKDYVLVSLARAGTPVAILLKRELERLNHRPYKHYSISIIRGQGIDKNAMNHIIHMNLGKPILFVDGWTGKGAITRQLQEAMQDYPVLDWALGVLADSAGTADFAGTRDDFLIPISCLNSTVSGMLSRTVYRKDLVNEHEMHGSVQYTELKDRTYDFIDAVPLSSLPTLTGYEETKLLAKEFNVKDINLIKPGIGETTRVLLRRVPDVIYVHDLNDTKYLGHIFQLAKDKGVPVLEHRLQNYRCLGIIKKSGDA